MKQINSSGNKLINEASLKPGENVVDQKVTSFKFALVRPLSISYPQALNDWYQKSSQKPQEIDFTKALIQHQLYTKTLESLGLEVVKLDPETKFPDSCFIQDPCLIYKDKAFKLNQFAKSRQGEDKTIEAFLSAKRISIQQMARGFADGGDVLVLDDLKVVLVGISKRTNKAGFNQVQKFYQPFKFNVIAVPVTKCLHLMTATTYLGQGIFLISGLLDKETLSTVKSLAKQVVLVPAKETYAVNTICINKQVLMPKGYPITKKKIIDLGFKVLETPMSEFEKADGGISCLSLIY